MFCILLYPFIFGLSYLFFKAGEKRTNAPIEDLKNALLIYALNTIYPEDFEKEPTTDYESFDGSKLPSLYECFNNVSTYFNYVVQYDVRERSNAISAYLENRFQSRADVESFFKNYVGAVDAAFEAEVYINDEELGNMLDEKHYQAQDNSPISNTNTDTNVANNVTVALATDTNTHIENNQEPTPSHPVEVDSIVVEDDYDHIESSESKKDV